jgi:hypothetical protein
VGIENDRDLPEVGDCCERSSRAVVCTKSPRKRDGDKQVVDFGYSVVLDTMKVE